MPTNRNLLSFIWCTFSFDESFYLSFIVSAIAIITLNILKLNYKKTNKKLLILTQKSDFYWNRSTLINMLILISLSWKFFIIQSFLYCYKTYLFLIAALFC